MTTHDLHHGHPPADPRVVAIERRKRLRQRRAMVFAILAGLVLGYALGAMAGYFPFPAQNDRSFLANAIRLLGLVALVAMVVFGFLSTAIGNRATIGGIPRWGLRSGRDPRAPDATQDGHGALDSGSRAGALVASAYDHEADWKRAAQDVHIEHPSDVPARVFERAAKKALHRARKALPHRGSVHVRTLANGGSHGATGLRIEVRGPGADGRWASAAADAFAAEFVTRLAKHGFEARRST